MITRSVALADLAVNHAAIRTLDALANGAAVPALTMADAHIDATDTDPHSGPVTVANALGAEHHAAVRALDALAHGAAGHLFGARSRGLQRRVEETGAGGLCRRGHQRSRG